MARNSVEWRGPELIPGGLPERGIIMIRKLAPVLVLTALLTLFTATNASAQVCASLTLTTQAQVDAVSPERAPSSLLVRMPSIGGAENAACFSYARSGVERTCSKATPKFGCATRYACAAAQLSPPPVPHSVLRIPHPRTYAHGLLTNTTNSATSPSRRPACRSLVRSVR
jgi:hypothetical protein